MARIISAWDYAYDDVGNVTSQTDKDDAVTAYTYDDVYQLTHVGYPSGSDYEYEYDGVGNRTEMHELTQGGSITTAYSYDSADELTQYVVGDQTVTLGYASDVCLTSKSDGTDTYEYVWDQERRLTAFKKNGSTLVEYAYNPTGTRRTASDATLGVERYFHSGAHVLADFDCGWGMNRSYVLGPSVDEVICMLDHGEDSISPYYFMRDRLGSTLELVNAGETVNTRCAYDVWGARTEAHLSGQVSSQYSFTWRERDPTLGLYYYRARYYANELGRFVSRDPLYHGARGHVDNYAYVGGNPATLVDPSGLVYDLGQAVAFAGGAFLSPCSTRGSDCM